VTALRARRSEEVIKAPVGHCVMHHEATVDGPERYRSSDTDGRNVLAIGAVQSQKFSASILLPTKECEKRRRSAALSSVRSIHDPLHLVLNGDMPFFLGNMDLLVTDLSNWNVKGEIIAVFHRDAAYLVLNDESYVANRRVQTGHPIQTGKPYGKLMAGLMKPGIQIELCGATAAANHWINKDLFPGVKANTNAMVRVTELEQKGFTLIYE
jgi:intracellular sulfur oxidation DsrE/DsrF family protein